MSDVKRYGDADEAVRTSRRARMRDDLEGVTPYGAPQLDVAIRLNTNETSQPPPASYLDDVAERIRGLKLNRYPDREHLELRTALSRRFGRRADEAWAANGSNEVLLQLLQAYGGPGRTAMYVRPGYSMYPEVCRTTLTRAVPIDLDDDFGLTADDAAAVVRAHDPAVVLMSSPNNPVGSLVGHDVVRAIHDTCSGLIVVDEAYVEFAPKDASVTWLLDDLPRLVVVRTLSKAFRLAGLRLGYLLAAPWVIDDLHAVRLPYHLDAMKQVAAITALEHDEEFLDHRDEVASQRERVTAALRERGDVEVFDSAANFFLMRSGEPRLFDRLLDEGVLVRDFSAQPKLEGCVRVTVGTAEENDAFLTALAVVLNTPSERT